MTAIAGAVWTAAQFNTFIRDNLNETLPALATVSGNYFVTTSTHHLAERKIYQDYIAVQNGFDSTSYDDPDLAGAAGEAITVGPTVTCFTGTTALVVVGGRIGGGSTSTQSVKMSWEVSGDSSISATDEWAAGPVGFGGVTTFAYTSRPFLCTTLTEGINTFTAKYAVSSTPGLASGRTLLVMPF
jgi:hypothetical protein